MRPQGVSLLRPTLRILPAATALASAPNCSSKGTACRPQQVSQQVSPQVSQHVGQQGGSCRHFVQHPAAAPVVQYAGRRLAMPSSRSAAMW